MRHFIFRSGVGADSDGLRTAVLYLGMAGVNLSSYKMSAWLRPFMLRRVGKDRCFGS